MVEPLADGVGLLGPLDELFPDMSETDWAPYRDRYPELVSGNDWRWTRRLAPRLRADNAGNGIEGMGNDWRLSIMCFLLRG